MHLFRSEAAERDLSADRVHEPLTTQHTFRPERLDPTCPVTEGFPMLLTENPGPGVVQPKAPERPNLREIHREARKRLFSLPSMEPGLAPRGVKTPGGDGHGGAAPDESSAPVSGSSAFFVWGFWARACLS